MNKSIAALITFSLTAPLLAGPCFELPSPSAGNPKHLEEFHWVNEVPEDRSIHPKLKHLTFYSKANQTEIGFYLYKPEGYADTQNAEKRYPVIYHLHGGRPGAEFKGTGSFGDIYNSMQSGLRPQTFYVFPNGGCLSHYDWHESKGETAFLELVEHIDATYRTINDRKGRIIQGGSQGGRGAARYIFKFPEHFCAALAMAAGHQWEYIISQNNGVESPDLTIDDPKTNSWDLAAAYAADPSKPQVKVMTVIGDHDNNYQSNLAYHMHLNALGIDNQLVIVPNSGHGIKLSNPDVGKRILSFPTEIWKENSVIE